MPLGFHPAIHVAFTGDSAIVLDVAADRYQRLGSALTAALKAALAGVRDPSAVAALVDAGLLVRDGAHRPLALPALPPPIRTFRGAASTPVRLAFGRSLGALLTSRRRLHGSSLAQVLVGARRRATLVRYHDDGAASGLAQRFASHRDWLPLRPSCLADGLALHALLSGERLAASLVIGVRDQPFAAHCWVQAGDVVLSDTLDAVAELTPILVL